MNPEILNKQKHLESLQMFMSSPAYTGFIAAQKVSIETVKDRILLTPPVDPASHAACLMAHGELEVHQEQLLVFESACRTLRTRISELTDIENEAAVNTKV